MRALIVTQHFAPEVTAGRFRIEAFAKALVERGHEVEVLCPVPNHPRGIVEPGYRGRIAVRRRVGGARVTYLWVAASPAKTVAARLRYYGSFAAMATLAGALWPRPDVVVASSPPLTVGAAGALLAARHRAPLVFDARDVWPQSAVALGELRSRRAIAAAEWLERWIYRHAAMLVTVNEEFRRQIEARAPARAPLELVPNGTTREWLAAGESEGEPEADGYPPGCFVWAYAGNLGLAQELDVAVEAAAELGDEFLLVLVGDGVRRREIERLARERAPGRVRFTGLVEPGRAARALRAADALLVSERQPTTVPSKLYDCCAVGRPVVAAGAGEIERVVAAEEIALPVGLGNPQALAAAVRRLRDEPKLGERLVERGRAFAVRNLRERHAERFAELVEDVAGAPSARAR